MFHTPCACQAADCNAPHTLPTPQCEDFAQQVAARGRAAGFAVTLTSLDAALAAGGDKPLPAAGAVAIVTSTYNGNPPDNAAAFAKWAAAAGPGAAAGVKFAVFGVGNSQWAATFQAFPKKVDAALSKAGGAALLPLATVDVDKAGLTDVFEEWVDALASALLSAFQVRLSMGSRCVLLSCRPAAPGYLSRGDGWQCDTGISSCHLAFVVPPSAGRRARRRRRARARQAARCA